MKNLTMLALLADALERIGAVGVAFPSPDEPELRTIADLRYVCLPDSMFDCRRIAVWKSADGTLFPDPVSRNLHDGISDGKVRYTTPEGVALVQEPGSLCLGCYYRAPKNPPPPYGAFSFLACDCKAPLGIPRDACSAEIRNGGTGARWVVEEKIPKL